MMLLAACGGSKGNLQTEEPTPTVTHAAKLPTSEPSPIPTSSPTPTDRPVDLLGKSEELRGIVFPARAASATATGALVKGAEKTLFACGVSWNNTLTVRDAFKPGNNRYPRLQGLKADDVQLGINERIGEVATAMTEDAYLPEVEGIEEILETFGRPGGNMDYEVTFNREGVFSFRLIRTWRWMESGTFDFLSQAGDYMRGRWPEDDDRFTTRYEYVAADQEGKAVVRMFYQITESVGMTFNLRNGMEMSLSDLFAEGSDYVSFLNGELGKIYRDDYLYGPLLTNQSVTIPGVSGQENFYLVDNGESMAVAVVGKLHGGDAKVTLTEPVGIEAPWRPFQDAGGYVFRPLGVMEMADWSHESEHEPVFGSFAFRPDGGEEITVTVRYSKNDYKWTATLGADQINRIDGWLSGAKLIDIAKQALGTCEADFFEPGRDLNLILEKGMLFPNGYCYFELCCGDVNDAYVSNGINVWLKDGQCISADEIFDASGEQILTEMFTGLHYANFGPEITAEEAKAAAKLLAKYFRFDVSEDFFGKAQSEELHWDMVSFGEYDFRYEGRAYGEDYLPAEVRANLPEVLMDNLSWDRYVTSGNLVMTEPLALWKHLRLYEGCKFGI